MSLFKTSFKLNKKIPLIVAVSGGSDSMALLHYLMHHHYQLIVAHFNHGLRLESFEEAKYLEDFCKTHHIPYVHERFNIPKKGNFHHQAHLLRKEKLMKIASLNQTPYILTAHHLDDLSETMVMRFVRGSNMLGYAGMQPYYEKDHFIFVKPFLYTKKSEIMDYIKVHQIKYFEDASNQENDYFRNRLRHDVLPLMQKENPNFYNQMIQYHQQLSHAFFDIRSQAQSFLNQKDVISIAYYQSLDLSIRYEVIALMIEKNHLNSTYSLIKRIDQMLLNPKSSSQIIINQDYQFEKSYDHAFIRSIKPTLSFDVPLLMGKNILPNMNIFTLLDSKDNIEPHFIELCYNKVTFPLRIRTRKNGDVLAFSYGHKKLKKLLIDLKIPKKDRENMLIITDSDDQILWIPNLYLNQTLGTQKHLYLHVEGDNHAS